MLDFNAVLTAVCAVFLLFLFGRRNRSKDNGKRYPPSIPSLPLLGSIPFFTGTLESTQLFFMRKAEQLGPVILLRAGKRLAVSINGKEAIVEAMQRHSEAFGDRPDFWTETNILNPDLRGVAFSRYNDDFKHYHKLTLSILKEYGFGVNQEMDIRISKEIEGFITEVRKQNGLPFDPKSILLYSTSNVLMSILFGSESQAGVKRSELIEDANAFIENIDPIIDYVPFIRFLPRYDKKITDLTNAQKGLFAKFEISIEHNKRNPTERNFVSRFLEIEGPNYSHQDLLYILRDLCFGSAVTVESVLRWALKELANHPDVQSRLQKEVDEVSSGNRILSIDDRPHLPFSEAVMFEVMRRHTITYTPVPRLTMKDTEICGCFIPSKCLVISNMYSVHMDPKTWGDPENFRPERFLDKDNNVIRKKDIMPFHLGKRSCIGEIQARQEIFLFLVNIVQHFDIKPPEGQDHVIAEDVHALVVAPSRFQIRLIPRIKQ